MLVLWWTAPFFLREQSPAFCCAWTKRSLGRDLEKFCLLFRRHSTKPLQGRPGSSKRQPEDYQKLIRVQSIALCPHHHVNTENEASNPITVGLQGAADESSDARGRETFSLGWLLLRGVCILLAGINPLIPLITINCVRVSSASSPKDCNRFAAYI